MVPPSAMSATTGDSIAHDDLLAVILQPSSVIQRHRRRKRKVKRITIDLDPTHDATHGGQQLSFFNWHYDSWCYLPLAGFLSFDNEPDQYLFCCVLRAGNAGRAR